MGFLDKLRGKKVEVKEKPQQDTSTKQESPPPGRRIKKYTSEGKPIYE
jgi:hypothetical protein